MIKTGLQVLLKSQFHLIANQRVGLISHSAAVLPDITRSVEALLHAGVQLRALFSGEHGFSGSTAETKHVDHSMDAASGLPIYSLYGLSKELSATYLDAIDVILFDMQDIGARFYTFLSTLRYVLLSAAQNHKPVVVLDRPNPINGVDLEGPLLRPGYESFVGPAEIPIRHAMTYGELAQMMNEEQDIGADLTIIPMQGWRRTMWFDQTGLPWVPPSPGMAHFPAAIVFPGTCLIEGTNLSEGRGTALPFEILGAPWLDGDRLAKHLDQHAIPGVHFQPITFQPCTAKHAGSLCSGVQIHVIDRQVFQPLITGVRILAACQEIAQDKYEILPTSWEGDRPHLDYLMGSNELRLALNSGLDITDLENQWSQDINTFLHRRQAFLLYE